MKSENTIKDICPQKKCTGCSACFNACKQNAITMVEDACGFFYPHIDETKCIGCGLCQKSCPVNTKPALNYPADCYATAIIGEDELLKSASGGAATMFMKKIIDEGGVVYGCTGKDIFHVHHLRVNTEDGIEQLRGSKYVQSLVGEVYEQVKNDLRDTEHLVLFTGTPCQVAGLKGFLRKDYDNLITVDLVCHGVPSQKMLNDNIRLYTSEKDGEKIKVAFRRKVPSAKPTTKFNSARIEFGWFCEQNQPYSSFARKPYKDPYMFGFLSCLTFRESCYTCRYATAARVGDITISDFWGLGNDTPFEHGKGVSAVLLNTEKGCRFFNTVKDEMTCVQRDPIEAIIGNGQLQSPSRKRSSHNAFISSYPQIGFAKAVSKSLRKEKIKLLVLKPFFNSIRKILK